MTLLQQILTIIPFFAVTLLNAQDSSTQVVDENRILIPLFVDTVPEFEAGDEAYRKWLKDVLHFPDSMKNTFTKGYVKVNFVVEKNGTISNLDVWYNQNCPGCESIVINAFTNSPKWKPALRNGEPVRCKLTQELTFKMSYTDRNK